MTSEVIGNGVFVAVGGTDNLGFKPPGQFQIIITSPDGIHWTTRSWGGDALYSVAYENNTFIAVGGNGTILTSRDGITWNVKDSGTTAYLTGVAYGNNTFIAVGPNGTNLQSDTICTASVSSASSLNIPIINFNNNYLWADLQYMQGATGNVMFKATNSGVVSNPADYSGCEASTLVSDNGGYKLHIPKLNYNNTFYSADLEYVPTTDGETWFKLTGGTAYQ